MCYVYILKCDDCSYYIGASKNLTERLKKHNKAQVKYTKSRLPVKLIYKEEYSTFKEATKREKQIKSWKKRRAIENLIKRKGGPIVCRHTILDFSRNRCRACAALTFSMLRAGIMA